MNAKMNNTHIAVYIPSLGSGGGDKMALNLCRGLSKLKYNVDLIVLKDDVLKNNLINSLELHNTRLIYFDKNTKKRIRDLVNYLKKEQPEVILSAKGGDVETIKAKKIAKVATKVVLRHGTTFSQRDKYRPFFRRIISKIKLRWIFSRADLIIANSKGVANDVIKIGKIPAEKVKVLPNPTIVPEMFKLGEEKIEHEWFLNKDSYIILGAGGFRKSKDFPTLVKAFFLLQKEVSARLVILGQGRQKKKIEGLIEYFGIKDKVWLPGHEDNPYKFMAKSDLFVLTSLWEGCPNVLIEALAFGTPVVSTDCPSGPREILQNGIYGKLVPLRDPEKLKEAMKFTLKNPMPKHFLKQAVTSYTLDESCKAYAMALGLR